MKRLLSFKYALLGLKDLMASEPNARIHLGMAALALIMGWWLQLSTLEWALIVLCISMVLAAEAFNTAIEHLTDLVSPDFHPLAGKTKDVAAAAVLLSAAGAALTGLVVLGPKLWSKLILVF